jgi:hypothetical protein
MAVAAGAPLPVIVPGKKKAPANQGLLERETNPTWIR